MTSRPCGIILAPIKVKCVDTKLNTVFIRNNQKNLCSFTKLSSYTVNNYMQVTGTATGENFAFFIYRHFVEIL